MEAISTHSGAYSHPPNGHMPAQCPRCQAYLGQFLQQAPENTDVGVIARPQMPPLPELLGPTGLQQEKIAARPKDPPVIIEPQPVTASVGDDIFSHPEIGGQLTLFVLLYGQDFNTHRRTLRALASTQHLDKLVIRVICRNTVPGTMRLLQTIQFDHVYADTKLGDKFEIMRRVFRDPEHPIQTRWVVWMDDFVWAKRADWLRALAQTIATQSPAENVGAVGPKLCHPLPPSTDIDWFRQAAWYRGEPFHNRQGVTAPNGDCIHFASPNFFAIKREAIEVCDIPDARVKQRGGGVTIGAQLHQHGYKIKSFNSDQKYAFAQQPERKGKDPCPWERT